MYRVLCRLPLFNNNISRHYYSTKNNELINSLKKAIRAIGPISIAQYMREVLTNSHGGYYMTGDVFGRQGDFVTSPEISQIFADWNMVFDPMAKSRKTKQNPDYRIGSRKRNVTL
ncbi:34656_t:CDS:2 [Racocetra persica]|uniref:34656_t:CDS:1 n=1 Tax=Racocetra persica TaxID=160502 RepID=A0ACA9KRA3_9GLOM|nr:34656_t:CDS:2 [Racocetra persica]